MTPTKTEIISGDQHREVSERRIGPYMVESMIGRGGMGIVFRAHRLNDSTPVALKTARTPRAESCERLRNEIRVLMGLRHRGVVTIFEHGSDHDRPWYAMELVEGQNVRHFNRVIWGRSDERTISTVTTALDLFDEGERPGGRCEQPPLDSEIVAAGRLSDLLSVYGNVCEALDHIHGAGVFHRDVSPSNILLRPDGRAVLADFGLAVVNQGNDPRQGKCVGGSADYVAPEQIEGKGSGHRADLYSLGCMIYETATGHVPFASPTRGPTLRAHLAETPIPPSEVVAEMPPALNRLILALLQKNPNDRPASAADVGSELASLRFGGRRLRVVE